MTWREEYAELIADGMNEAPADMPLAERIKAVDCLRPKGGAMSCSWPQKAWQAARRDYLVPFGYEPKTKKAVERRSAVSEPLPLFTMHE